MRKLFISLCFSACCSLLAAQTTNPIQEAMANYDYETALMQPAGRKGQFRLCTTP